MFFSEFYENLYFFMHFLSSVTDAYLLPKEEQATTTELTSTQTNTLPQTPVATSNTCEFCFGEMESAQVLAEHVAEFHNFVSS